MGSNRNYSQREKRKAPASVPAVPDLGRLSMPRKTNRAAALIVASGDVLWDKRRVDRKARKRALETAAARETHKGFHQLSRKQKQWIINHIPAWSWNTETAALQAPTKVTQQQLDELIEVTRLPYVQRAVITVQGLSLAELEYVTERAPRTARFVLLDTQTMHRQTVRTPRISAHDHVRTPAIDDVTARSGRTILAVNASQ